MFEFALIIVSSSLMFITSYKFFGWVKKVVYAYNIMCNANKGTLLVTITFYFVLLVSSICFSLFASMVLLNVVETLL